VGWDPRPGGVGSISGRVDVGATSSPRQNRDMTHFGRNVGAGQQRVECGILRRRTCYKAWHRVALPRMYQTSSKGQPPNGAGSSRIRTRRRCSPGNPLRAACATAFPMDGYSATTAGSRSRQAANVGSSANRPAAPALPVHPQVVADRLATRVVARLRCVLSQRTEARVTGIEPRAAVAGHVSLRVRSVRTGAPPCPPRPRVALDALEGRQRRSWSVGTASYPLR